MDGFHGSAVPDGKVRAEFIHQVDPDQQTSFSHSPEATHGTMFSHGICPVGASASVWWLQIVWTLGPRG